MIFGQGAETGAPKERVFVKFGVFSKKRLRQMSTVFSAQKKVFRGHRSPRGGQNISRGARAPYFPRLWL